MEQEEVKFRIGFQSINGLTTLYSSLAPVVSSFLWFTMNKTVLLIKDAVYTQDQPSAYCEPDKVCLVPSPASWLELLPFCPYRSQGSLLVVKTLFVLIFPTHKYVLNT